jgi:Xaa-Pro aminopeptidase
VEPPFIGTDLGFAAEERMVLEPGMVLVLEPYVWEEGQGGYRAEHMLVVTTSGVEALSAPPP